MRHSLKLYRIFINILSCESQPIVANVKDMYFRFLIHKKPCQEKTNFEKENETLKNTSSDSFPSQNGAEKRKSKWEKKKGIHKNNHLHNFVSC